jgi:hypothetical protein
MLLWRETTLCDCFALVRYGAFFLRVEFATSNRGPLFLTTHEEDHLWTPGSAGKRFAT